MIEEFRLTALSPLDGRYGEAVTELSFYFSEWALQRYRVYVEIEWFVFLCNDLRLKGTRRLTAGELKKLRATYQEFSGEFGLRIKELEETTNHDVKAVEYFVRDVLKKCKLGALQSFVHFGCTSEDINNISYALLLHAAVDGPLSTRMKEVVAAIRGLARRYRRVPMLAHTHGQPASPTTVGKEFMNVAMRLDRQSELFNRSIVFLAKMNGAVGNYNAHAVAYPDVDWIAASKRFVKALGLTPNVHTTQIEPHDWQAELFDLSRRVDVILIDFCRDMWSYISRGYFGQKTKKGEIGSSTMPHKVNPIDFENAEGNFGIANALFGHFSEKLPISRMQRDLSDSTVQRNFGVAFGHMMLGFISLLKGLDKIVVHEAVLAAELNNHYEILGEAVQMVLRRHGVADAYERLKAATRGKEFTREAYLKLVAGLPIPEADRSRLSKLTPATYVGLAEKLV